MDRIREQLKLLDEQIAERESLFGFFTSRSPLFVLAVAFTCGVAAQRWAEVHAGVWFSVCIAAAAAGVWRKEAGRSWVAVLAVLIFFSAGALRVQCYYRLPANHISRVAPAERSLASLRGRVASSVFTPARDGWAFAGWGFNKGGSSFYMQCEEVLTGKGFVPVCGRVRVQVGSKVRSVRCGDRVEVHCWLDRFGGPSNPGEFDFKRYLERRNIHFGASVPSASSVKVLERAGRINLTGVREKLANLFREELGAVESAGSESAGLVEALLLGRRGNIDTRTEAAFRRTGLAHFISLSGMHVGMFVLFVWGMAKHAGLLKTGRAVLLVVVLTVYVLTVPTRPPIMRAAILCYFFALSMIVRRRADAMNTLGLAGLCLLMWEPSQLFNAGFQLSFAAVLGILLLQRRFAVVANRFGGWWLQAKYESVQESGYKFLLWVGKLAVELLTVGVAAWIGGAGIILWHFGSVSPASAVWTVIAYPLVLAIVAGGLVQIAIGFVFPTIGVACGIFVDSVAESLILLVRGLAEIDFTALQVGKISGWFVVGFYAAVLFVRFGRFKLPAIRRVGVCAGCVVMLVPIGIHLVGTGGEGLRMTVLDVGHGQAVVLETESGANLLLDAGSLTRNDVGSRVVLPFLQSQGIDRLDAVCVSHDDLDHLNGLPEVVQQCGVGRLYLNNSVLTNASATAEFLGETLAELGCEAEGVPWMIYEDGDVKVEAIWPMGEDGADLSDNDRSSVFLVTYAGRRILLTSDIEEYAQGRLLELYPELRADVVVLPHHGSKLHLLNKFVEKLGPEVVIASCSAGRVSSVHRPTGIRMLDTATDGAVTVLVGEDGELKTEGFLR